MKEWTNEWRTDKGSLFPLSVHEFYSLLFLFPDQVLSIAEREHLPMFLLTIWRLGLTSFSEEQPQQWVFKLIYLCCQSTQPIYHSNLCKCHSSIQLYVSCILRLHSSWGLCKANLSWINQEIPWCMLYVEEVLPSLLKWTNPLSAVYLYTLQNTSKPLPSPRGCDL